MLPKLVIFASLAVLVVFALPHLLARFRGNFSSAPQAGAQTAPDQARSVARKPLSGALVQAKLRIDPSGGAAQVLLDQRPVDPNSIRVRVGTTAKLQILMAGFKPYEKDITAMSATDPVEVSAVLEPDRFGTLSLHTTPTAEARISMNEWVWMQNTPLEQLKLPPGTYQIQLVNQLLGMRKTLSLTIEAGKDLSQDVNLDVIK